MFGPSPLVRAVGQISESNHVTWRSPALFPARFFSLILLCQRTGHYPIQPTCFMSAIQKHFDRLVADLSIALELVKSGDKNQQSEAKKDLRKTIVCAISLNVAQAVDADGRRNVVLS